MHLLPELIENATIFSSKDTPVQVSGQKLSSGGPECDTDLVSHEMTLLVEAVGDVLRRRPVPLSDPRVPRLSSPAAGRAPPLR